MKRKRLGKMETWGIQYMGEPGITQECINAIIILLQGGNEITQTRILSCSNEHCLLLTVNDYNLIAIKSGFGSGYLGEGAAGFSYVLQLLHFHGSKITEHDVTNDLIERLDNSALTKIDVRKLEDRSSLRPVRWHDYIIENSHRAKEINIWKKFRPVIPYAIIDNRIADLAVSFWNNPDEKLFIGYRRLEEIVRKKSGIKEHGQKLFSQAFIKGPLSWKNCDEGEKIGRTNLFTSTFMAYRNPRIHKELKNDSAANQLNEFLLLNNLYILEADSFEIPVLSGLSS